MGLILHILFTIALASNFYCKVYGQNNTGTSNSQNSVTSGTTDELTPLEKGVQTLYDIVHNFLDLVQREDFFDSSASLNFTTLEDIIRQGDYSELQSRWQDLANVFAGFAASIIIGLLFVVAMPIAGCIWCCCYCCCKTCGKAKDLEDPPHAKCKRSTCCTLLFLFTVMMLAGAVVAAISNEILHQKLENSDNRGPIGKLNTSFINLRMYAENTVEDIQTTTNNTLRQTVDRVKLTISDTVSTTVSAVQNSINSEALLNQVEQFGRDAESAQSSLSSISSTLNHINELNNRIQTILSGVSSNITTTCVGLPANTGNSCPNVSNLNTNTNFTGVSDLQNVANNVANTLEIGNLTKTARAEFDRVKNDISSQIDKTINDSLSQVDNINSQVQTNLHEVNNTVQPFVDSINKEVNPRLSSLDNDLKTYGDYWWYGGIAASCLVLLVVLFYLLGILFGVFGERPGRGANCCNRGAASNFLVAGVVCSYFFAWILMFLVIIMFTVGGMSYTMFCRYLNDGVENVEKYEILIQSTADVSLKQVLYKDANVDITIGGVLKDCKNNAALYSALKLQNRFDLEALLNVSQVTDEVNKIKNSDFLNALGNISIIPADLETKLDDFSKSGIATINFTQYDEQFQKYLLSKQNDLVTVNLDTLISDLETLATAIRPTNSTQADALQAEANTLKDLKKGEITELRNNLTALNHSLQEVKGKTNIINETSDLIAHLQAAERTFNDEGRDIVNRTMFETLDNITDYIVTQTKSLITKITNDTGKCRPVYDSAQGITDSLCSVVLDPLNGFWFGMGWAIFFYIPCIIFALCLGNLYQRQERYDKEEARRRKREDFDSPDMNMYHGGGGYDGYHGHGSSDNIPLTSVDRYGGGRQNGVSNAGYERHGGGGGRNNDGDMYYRNGEPQGYARPPSYHEDMSHYPPPQHAGYMPKRQYY